MSGSLTFKIFTNKEKDKQMVTPMCCLSITKRRSESPTDKMVENQITGAFTADATVNKNFQAL